MSSVKSVLCVGCTVIDFVTINGSYPKEDTDRRCLDGFWQRGGNASNVSTVLRVLGCKVDFFGMLSRSDGFRVLLDDLSKREIGTNDCPFTDRDPPFSSVILAQDSGTRTIIHCNKDYPQTTYEDFSKINLSQYGWVHFEARNTPHTLKMMQSIREYNQRTGQGIIISLDFETRSWLVSWAGRHRGSRVRSWPPKFQEVVRILSSFVPGEAPELELWMPMGTTMKCPPINRIRWWTRWEPVTVSWRDSSTPPSRLVEV
ncbi:ketohexokinase isoform X3 [Drosophila mauritiana]|uniref:Ketohexokinase isoform X3 n=1 Tax=Drosophila mauritiana TaxID=7226 RepID=A0A6P8JMH6_DROMA|nr:ketohexokinase isoform X3 [Drosophila mauritiana]